MPRFDLSINGADVDSAEAREDWKGPLPPKGAYPAKLRLMQIKAIKGSNTRKRISVMAILQTENIDGQEEYHECPCWGGFNLDEAGIPYLNQFLDSLTDGSDSAIKKIRTAFYPPRGPIVDEKKVNVLKIGTLKINSPEGELPIMITVGHNTWEGKTTAKAVSFLIPGSDAANSIGAVEEVIGEDDEDEDESVVYAKVNTDGEVDAESLFNEDEDADEDEDEDEDAEEVTAGT